MNIFHLPKHAKTLEKELTTILIDDSNSDLSKEQLFGIALASAYAQKDNDLINNFLNYARDHITVSTIILSKYAASFAESNGSCKHQESLKTDFKSAFSVRDNKEIAKCNLGPDFDSTFTDYDIGQHSSEPSSVEGEGSALSESKLPLEYDTKLYLLAAMYTNGRETSINIVAKSIYGLLIKKGILKTIVRLSFLIYEISTQLACLNLTNIKVLLIDDDPRLTRRLKLMLERDTNFLVKTENNSLKALTVARQFSPDLIVLDLYMPGKNGGEILNSLQLDPNLSSIKVMFLTSMLTKEEAGERGKMINGNLFLAKPTDDNVLISTIREQLNRPEPMAV